MVEGGDSLGRDEKRKPNSDRPCIYIDVCCLNRPFDDQSQERIRIESEAVLLILTMCEDGRLRLLGSEAIDLEIALTPDERREKVMYLAGLAKSKVIVSDRVASRARELEALGFDVFDALHLACAEEDAEVLLTTDDKFLSRARGHADKIKVRVENPVLWLMELLE